MSDTMRGLIIGVVVGLIGGMLVGAIVVGLVKEYAGPTGFTRLIRDYGMLASIVIGAITGAVGSYRMLQNLPQKTKE